jgi:hypothetical protein
MAPRRRIYWDANCYIALIRNEPRFSAQLTQIVKAAEDGEVQLIGSSLVLLEVQRPPQSDPSHGLPATSANRRSFPCLPSRTSR